MDFIRPIYGVWTVTPCGRKGKEKSTEHKGHSVFVLSRINFVSLGG